MKAGESRAYGGEAGDSMWTNSGKVGDPGTRGVSGIYCWGGKKTKGYPERKFGKSARSLGRGSLRDTIEDGRLKVSGLIILFIRLNIVHMSDSTPYTAVSNRGIYSLVKN